MRPRIILLVGLPGSGKSTWAARQGYPVLASDEIRKLLLDDMTDQRINRRIFSLLRYLLRLRLEIGRPVTCVDATHLTSAERRPYIAMGEVYGADVEAVYFDVPIEVCKQRNRARSRVVPDEIMDRMQRRLVPPSESEGLTSVVVVRE